MENHLTFHNYYLFLVNKLFKNRDWLLKHAKQHNLRPQRRRRLNNKIFEQKSSQRDPTMP